jgi:replicative DNA helicase
LLQARREASRRAELKSQAVELANAHGDQPEMLVAEIERIVREAARDSGHANAYPCEIREIIPYVQRLTMRQTGAEFLGLDSGFRHFNNLCNGLDTGLVILAAPPGAGKTTWSFQVACQVAAINQLPVVFVSMEQSKEELRAKALARLSKLQYRHILRGRLRSDDPQDLAKLLAAARQYALFSGHLTIVEGDENTTVEAIAQVAGMKMAKSGADRCFVVVDYLQILPLRQDDTRRVTSTKDRVDLHVTMLRRMARQLDSPVLVISAENRAGYKSKQMDVFKESGGIEYSADIAMVLTGQRNGSAEQPVDYRMMDLNVPKNRNGERGVVKFKFYPQRAEFIEEGKGELPDDPND